MNEKIGGSRFLSVEEFHKREELLRVPEFAARLNIEESTARAWVLRRRVSIVRISSRAIRIPASEVDRIIAEGTIPAREDRYAR